MSEAAVQSYCYTSMSTSSQRQEYDSSPTSFRPARITAGPSASPLTELRILTKVGKFRLKRRLSITITQDGGLFFAENQELNLWGEGSTSEEAILSLERFFLYDLKSYLKTPPEKMDYYAAQELMRYKSILGLP